MDVKLKFYSDDCEIKPRLYLIKNNGTMIWTFQFLWFEFEIVRYYKKNNF